MKYTGQKWGFSGHGGCRRALGELRQWWCWGGWQGHGSCSVLGVSGKAPVGSGQVDCSVVGRVGGAQSDGGYGCWVWGDRLHCAVGQWFQGAS